MDENYEDQDDSDKDNVEEGYLEKQEDEQYQNNSDSLSRRTIRLYENQSFMNMNMNAYPLHPSSSLLHIINRNANDCSNININRLQRRYRLNGNENDRDMNVAATFPPYPSLLAP